MPVRITSKRVKRSIRQMLALLLLVLYVAVSLKPEIIHSYAHDHMALVSHSDEQETDPCHRLIYHSDFDQDCNHDSHLVVADKCQMCDLVYHGDKTLLSNISFAAREFGSEHFDFYKLSLDSYWAVISSSRAPPTLA